MPPAILALDQGTTSSRAMIFDRDGAVLAVAQHELPQIYPAPGEVEHDPEEIWRTQLAAARAALAQTGPGVEVAALGIANQRETTLVWERESGRPVANAIVWQSRVSEPICRRLREAGHEERIRAKTGLVVDPYFSGTKLQHLLDSIPGLRDRAERGEVLFGTVDSFLVWRLTGGRQHVTDVSNASRTLLFDLDALDWDDELLDLFGVPRAMLPEVRPTSAVYGETEPELLGMPLPIGSVVGDQQAATFGQACFAPGEAKNTYGTGAFLLVNTGARPVRGARGLLATVGWQLGEETVYCLEGSVFVAGAVVQWLRDGLGLIASAGEVEELARRAEDSGGVYFVPAFVGLGAPWWDPAARGTIVGLSRGTRAEHLARAALDAIAFQTRDLVTTMEEAGVTLTSLKVDGGAAVNDLLLQLQADQLGIPVQRPAVTETTALGAAWLAGLAVGLYRDLDEVRALWRADRELQPVAPRAESDARYRLWRKAVACARAWAE